MPGRFKVINKNSENNMVIFYRRYIFLDSFNFLDSSLANLMTIALRDNEKPDTPAFPLILDYVNGCQQKYTLLCRKGVFPYSHLSSLETLKESKLPSKEHFFDDLKNEPVSVDDFHHANNVWREFKCKNLQDYLEIYLSCDVLALAQIFENYREIGLREFSLDPTYYFSAPHFSWNCMLHYTGVEIELIQDQSIWDWIRKSIRGGLTYVATRYMKANLEHLADYDVNSPRTELRYLDVRGLYSFCLRRPLPLRNYRWLTRKQIERFDINNIRQGTGYILEVDVSYPPELHSLLRDLPPLPEHKIPCPSKWSPYQRRLATIIGQKNPKQKKLMADLEPKKNYVVHAEHLRVCLKIGIKMEKIHRILSFDEYPWAGSYIEFVEKKRQLAKDSFTSNYMKKMNNVIYGFLLKDVTKHQKTHLTTESKKFLRLSRKPNFKRWTIYARHLASVEMRPNSVLMSSPIIAGYTVLELSKMHMLKIWYFLLKRAYGENIKLCMSDTDSYIIGLVNQDNFNTMMKLHSRYFDLSDFQGEMKNNTNAKRAGTLKCELSGRDVIVEFCGLRAKCYCLRFASEQCDKKCKGVPKVAMKRLGFDDYVDALCSPVHNSLNKCKYLSIRSLNQRLFTIEESKSTLNSFDDKRLIEDNGIDTVPYGFIPTPHN